MKTKHLSFGKVGLKALSARLLGNVSSNVARFLVVFLLGIFPNGARAAVGTIISRTISTSAGDKTCQFQVTKENDQTGEYTVMLLKGSGDSNLSNCRALSIDVPDYVTYNNHLYWITAFDEFTFSNNSYLKTITVPWALEEIGQYCFRSCSALESVTGSGSLKVIGDHAFYGCNKLSVFPFENVEKIETYAFWHVDALDTIRLPQIKELERYAFAKGESASVGSTRKGIITLELGDSLKVIPTCCFEDHNYLNSLKLPATLEKVDTAAFNICSQLKIIEFPATLNYLARSAFKSSSSPDTVTFRGATPPTVQDISIVYPPFNGTAKTLLRVPIGSLSAYQNHEYWGKFQNIQEYEARVDQSLSLTSIPTRTYGDSSYVLPETTTEGLTLTWSSSNTGVATIIGGRILKINGAGTATITATQAGNSDYKPFSKTFSFIVNKSSLTISAMSYTIQEGDAIPTFEATYSGFKYSDDSSVLTMQPSFTCTATTSSAPGTYPIVVSGATALNYNITFVNGTLTIEERPYTPGDANGDESVDVADYSAIANYILGQAPAVFDEVAADVTQDDNVDVADYTGVANIILFGNYQGNQGNGVKAEGINSCHAYMTIDDAGLAEGKLTLHVNDANDFAAFQMDVRLPEEVAIAEATMTDGKQTKNLGFAQMKDGTWRLLYGTLDNRNVRLVGNTLLTLHLTTGNANAHGDITIDNILLAESNSTTHQLNSLHTGWTTGIADIEAKGGTKVYDVMGRLWNVNGKLPGGVYIVNGKKVIK